MTSQAAYQAIVMYMLLDILRSESNQTMKLSQLIKYNIRNNFYEKSHTKFCGKTTPKSFLKNQNWAYLWINSVRFYTTCFCCMLS